MKTSVKFGLIFAMVWIIINMVCFLTGISRDAFFILVLLNLFMLLSSISVGLFLTKKEKNWEKGIFPDDFKTAMQGGFVYAILISVFVFLYHWKIDNSIIDGLRADWVAAIHESIPNEEAFVEYQEKDPSWQDEDYDGYIEKQEDQVYGNISPRSIFFMHMLGLSMIAFIYSFGATVIMRRIVLRDAK
ncbi:DUF4199 family protein [Paracrocinitomix mangrovi]|uniref:DUF4199 family protein n=1 Tax=Paracrocinitomix mangrovi TaxID=2862509 RepID=UPI001C8DD31B|nr:DUF4199 family protein [Paracrocinitomix mangrovi]UKN01654.1 DUF4199 family protein [Paracrocinitomix mangrovi]